MRQSPRAKPAPGSTRRGLLASVLAMTFVLVARARSGEQGESEHSTHLPLKSSEAGDLSAAEFLALSRALTNKSELPEQIGIRLLERYRRNPGLISELSALYERISRAVSANPSTSANLYDWIQAGGLANDRLRALALLVVEHWYTGVDREDPDAVLMTYEDALMYRPCAGVHPIPTNCGGTMGFWAAPPETR